ncbi:MAG TPA: hypothetical protein VGM82_18430 [Gemmatimonadaceae bacterium]
MSRGLVVACVLAASSVSACAPSDDEPIRLPPVVVMADYRMSPAVVRGPSRNWWKDAKDAVHFGEPMPVTITMYCLRGRTRVGRQVRAGVAAADPRFFPLAQSIEIYFGRKYVGRFRVDDTGKNVHGNRVDVWTSDCGEARRFGIQRGMAVRVRGDPQIELSGSAVPLGVKPQE